MFPQTTPRRVEVASSADRTGFRLASQSSLPSQVDEKGSAFAISPQHVVLPRLPLQQTSLLSSSMDDNLLSRPRPPSDLTIFAQRGYSTERRLYSRETARLIQAENAHNRLQSQLRVATRSSGYREMIKHSPRPPPRPKKLPPMSTFSLTEPAEHDAEQYGCSDEDDGVERVPNEERDNQDIIDLVNTSFVQNWMSLTQSMQKAERNVDSHDVEENERIKAEAIRNFEKTWQEATQMLQMMKVSKQPSATVMPDREPEENQDKSRRVNSKKLPGRKRTRGPTQYLDVKEIQTLIQRQVSIGLLDPNDAPVLNDHIPLNSRMADFLSTLTSPLSMKINTRYGSFFDSEEWEQLHQRVETQVTNRRDFIAENAANLLSPRNREERIKMMASKRQERINQVLQQHDLIMDDYQQRMRSYDSRREMARYQRYVQEFIVPKQQLWFVVIQVVKFNRFLLRYRMELHGLLADYELMMYAASRIQTAYRSYRRYMARRTTMKQLRVIRFLTTIVRRIKFSKSAKAAALIKRFLRDIQEFSRAKYAVHIFLTRCKKIQAWWRGHLCKKAAQISMISYQFAQYEQILFNQLLPKDRQEIVRLALERKKTRTVQPQLPSSSTRKRFSGRRASATSESNAGASSNQAMSTKRNPLLSIFEDAMLEVTSETSGGSKGQSKKAPKKVLDWSSLEDGSPFDSGIREEIFAANWRMRRKAYTRALIEYLLISKAFSDGHLSCEVYDFSAQPVGKKKIALIERPKKPNFRVVIGLSEMQDIMKLGYARLKYGIPLDRFDESIEHYICSAEQTIDGLIVPQTDEEGGGGRRRRSRMTRKS